MESALDFYELRATMEDECTTVFLISGVSTSDRSSERNFRTSDVDLLRLSWSWHYPTWTLTAPAPYTTSCQQSHPELLLVAQVHQHYLYMETNCVCGVLESKGWKLLGGEILPSSGPLRTQAAGGALTLSVYVPFVLHTNAAIFTRIALARDDLFSALRKKDGYIMGGILNGPDVPIWIQGIATHLYLIQRLLLIPRKVWVHFFMAWRWRLNNE